MSDKIKKSDVEESLNIGVENGLFLAACPICKQYLSYNEYTLLNCKKCKKIKYKDITFYPGAKKENN